MKLESKNQKIWFCSDLHLGHDKEFIYKKRGFWNINDHDNYIQKAWEENIGTNDIVFNLGDATFNDKDTLRFISLASWPCAAHYILNGNHTSGHKKVLQNARNSTALTYGFEEAILRPKFNNIIFLGDYSELFIDGIPIILCHYPLESWNHKSSGAYHLHGHEHGELKTSLPSCFDDKRLDVGVEVAIDYNWLPFFSWDNIKAIMDKKSIKQVGHH